MTNDPKQPYKPQLIKGDVGGSASPEFEVCTAYTDWFDKILVEDSIGDIMINRHDRIFVEKQGKLEQLPLVLESKEALTMLADYIMRMCGKNLATEAQSFDGMLPGGSRVSIVLAPAAADGASIAIRKVSKHMLTFDDMVEQGILFPNVAAFLKAMAKARVNVLISGATSSGKTTLLNALSAYVSPDERVITIEDTAELQLQHKNVVRFEANDVDGGMSQRDLLKSALRMRGDRIIIGEIRGIEVFDFLQALNSGHDGSMGTIHANNPRDAFMRLELMIGMNSSNLTQKFIRQQIASSLNIVIQTQRFENGQRRISHITEVVGLEGDVIVAQELFVLSIDPKTGKANPPLFNFSSRNPKIQEAIQQAKLSGR